MTRIVPAILTDNPAELETLVRRAEGFAPYAQVDIMDGRFVPSLSVTCEQVAAMKIGIPWEAHLMVFDLEECVADFRRAGAQKIIFHYEAAPEPLKVIRRIRELGAEAGLAVNPETGIAEISPLVKEVDSVLFMAVHPGFYGAAFIPEVLGKIVEFRKAHPGVETGIDGGVKENNVAEIARTGVDSICVGSALFRAPQPGEAYKRLSALAGGL